MGWLACLVLLLVTACAPAAQAQTRLIVRDSLGLPGINLTCLLAGCKVVSGLGDPNGQLFRLINFHGSSFNDRVTDGNSFSGGWQGNAVHYHSSDGTTSGDASNAPENVLTEGYNVYYEGPTGAVSADGRLLVIPPPSASVPYRALPGPGDVVSILQDADGALNLSTIELP